MKQLLEKISKTSIELEDLEFQGKSVVDNWLGKAPANETEILDCEKKLGIALPEDYREFLLITNGFTGPNDIEPSFESLDKVDYLKNVIPELYEAYQIEELKNAIIIGGINEEQQFLLIPPDCKTKIWRYWKFANWIPGEHEFDDLQTYFENILEFLITSNKK